MENALAIADDPLFSEHRAPTDHPERPERLVAAREGVKAANLTGDKTTLEPRDATDDELGRVHSPAYLEALGRSAGKSGYFDPDTYFAESSVAAARRAAGGALAVVDALMGERATHGLALLRPPGHHALPGGAMGFCILNNVAVAAAHARARGASRVLIVDWDVHHGNGTQEMFYDDPSVLYVSLHQWPFYPGTGAAREVGERDGRGFTVNVPLSAGAGDAVYAAAFERLIGPIAEQFDPDLVLLSAGFDAHDLDPLGGMSLTDRGYAAMLTCLTDALPRGAAGRVGVVLEGGYDLTGLRDSLRTTLETLQGTFDAPPAAAGLGRHEADLAAAIEPQRSFWRLD